MKNLLCLLFTLGLIAGNSCNSTLDPEKETKAVKAVIEEERAAFFDRDFSRIEAIWIQESTSRKYYMNQIGMTNLTGWAELGEDDKGAIENDDLWENYKNPGVEYSNMNILIYENTALVFHDAQWSGNYMGEDMKMRQARTLHLVKVNGKWKFDLMSMYNLPEENIKNNKETSLQYHELNPDNTDKILAEGFIGQNEKSRHTWNRENHHNFLTNGAYKSDSIFNQVAEGDWVATRFFREMDWQGRQQAGRRLLRGLDSLRHLDDHAAQSPR